MPLTNVALQKIKPKEKTYRIYDGRGLYVEVSPKGGRWWRFKYKFNDKEKRISLGTYPEVSLKEARQQREDARSLIAKGID